MILCIVLVQLLGKLPIRIMLLYSTLPIRHAESISACACLDGFKYGCDESRDTISRVQNDGFVILRKYQPT